MPIVKKKKCDGNSSPLRRGKCAGKSSPLAYCQNKNVLVSPAHCEKENVPVSPANHQRIQAVALQQRNSCTSWWEKDAGTELTLILPEASRTRIRIALSYNYKIQQCSQMIKSNQLSFLPSLLCGSRRFALPVTLFGTWSWVFSIKLVCVELEVRRCQFCFCANNFKCFIQVCWPQWRVTINCKFFTTVSIEGI